MSVWMCVHICKSGAKQSLPEVSDSSLTSSSSFHSSLSSFCRIQHSSVTPPLRLLTFTTKNILNGNSLTSRKPFLLPEKCFFFLFLELITWTGQLERVAAGWCAACKVHAWCSVGHIHQSAGSGALRDQDLYESQKKKTWWHVIKNKLAKIISSYITSHIQTVTLFFFFF